jgi:hypothetical protein
VFFFRAERGRAKRIQNDTNMASATDINPSDASASAAKTTDAPVNFGRCKGQNKNAIKKRELAFDFANTHARAFLFKSARIYSSAPHAKA